MSCEERTIRELVIVGHLDLRWLRKFRARYPDARTVYWSASLDDAESLRRACLLAERVVVQDDLVRDFRTRVQVETTFLFERLSRFDARLAERCPPVPSSASVSREASGCFPVATGPVLFCPSNDTHTKLFEPIAAQLGDARFLYFDTRPEERAREMMESLAIEFVEGGAEKLAEIRPSVIVVGNDWYGYAWELFQEAYRLEIPTVCIQEGCLDFASKPRMQRCDYAFVQGPMMLDHLTHPLYFLTGNPRFDHLQAKPLPSEPVAMLNCNFTYDVEEEARDPWVHAVAAACEEAEIDFFLSQHPRDTGDFPSLPVRPSHAGVVHDHLADSSMLVTRFSTLVYEALLSGRQVVYYNPHGEAMRLFNEDQTGGIYVARDTHELVDAIERAARAWSDVLEPERRSNFLALHCGESDGDASSRCAAALASIASIASPRLGRRWWDFLRIWSDRRRGAY